VKGRQGNLVPHLLIIELPGGNDADVMLAAIDRGDEFTFLSAELDHYRRQPQLQAPLACARELIEVPWFDPSEAERLVMTVHAKRRIDAVLCLIDIRVPEAARLAHRLGVRHLNPASASLLRDKFSVRRRLAERGLEQPAFELAESNPALKLAVERLGLPVLIKPADGYGSQNIVVLRDAADLDPLMSPLEDMLPCRTDYGLGARANDRLLVERYMTGAFVGCDTLSEAGRHRMLGVHEKLMFEPPSFAMRGSCFTAGCTGFEATKRYVFAVLDALEFDWGAAHIELMITADGPRLIEINPRLVGAKIPRLVSYATGRSIHADLIALHAGEGLPLTMPRLAEAAVIRWIVATRAGTLDRVELPDWKDPRIRCVEVLKQQGEPVRPPFENADRIGYVMVSGRRAEAEEVADRFVAEARVRLCEEAPAHEREAERAC
jgi:biotin carboxylase